MKHDVLEHNVRRLLRRSYVPALPAPHFRDRLESLFLAEIERRRPLGRPGSRPALPKRRTSGLPLLLALAAALLALLVGWRFFASEAPLTPASLVARGEVALGFPDGSWRTAGAQERLHGLRVTAPVLLVVTPESVEFELLVASGRVHLGNSSELQLVLDGPGGEQEASATLLRGSAWFTRDGQRRIDLVQGVRAVLQGLLLAQAPAAPPAGARSPEARQALTTAPAPATPGVPPSARVFAGHVADAESGQSLRTFTVALLAERRGHQTFPPVQREFSDGDGFFAWEDPPSGKQRVFVHAEGHALRALGEFDFSSKLPELLVELETGVSVRGSVLDQHGNPIANALVLSENDAPIDGLLFEHSEYAFWLPIQARSQPDGRFELAHLTPGEHTLRANAAGFAMTWVDEVQAPLDARDELVITLGQGGAIEGKVTRDDGGPWAGVEVVAVAMDLVQRLRQSFALARTDAEGRYRFEHLPPMTILVVVMRSDERPDVRPVQVIEDETVQVDFFATTRGIRLHGHVLAKDGTPLPHRSLGLFDAETANWSQDWVASTTGADGAYAFEGVQPGRYALYLVDDIGRWLRCLGELELAPYALEVEHDLVVPSARFEVVCRDEDGAPAEQSALIVMRLEEDGRETFAGYGQTDAAGSFLFVEQRPGRYYVVAYPQQPGLAFARSELVEVSEDHGPELELLHEAGGAVDVLVRASDGRALEGASVLFRDETGAEHQLSRVPLTDSAGRYHAPGLRPGRYRVQAHLAGFQGAPVEFRYELGSELEVPVVLEPVVLQPVVLAPIPR